MNAEATVEELRRLVEKSQVCYEVWPEYLKAREKTVVIGFQVELFGTPPDTGEQRHVEWSQSSRTFTELRQIAEWIMPEEGRPSHYEIGPWDGALRYTSRRGLRPDVTLTIRILHRHGFDQPVDDCEKRCLKEMRDRLTDLGVPEGRWHPDLGRSVTPASNADRN